jgi:hypothetical protein
LNPQKGARAMGQVKVKRTMIAEIPRPPNFIKIEPAGTYVPLSDFTEKELKAIGREWTKKLVERSKEQKKGAHD